LIFKSTVKFQLRNKVRWRIGDKFEITDQFALKISIVVHYQRALASLPYSYIL